MTAEVQDSDGHDVWAPILPEAKRKIKTKSFLMIKSFEINTDLINDTYKYQEIVLMHWGVSMKFI